MRYLVLDLETLPVVNAADFITTDDIAAPANYKDSEKIAAYVEAERKERINRAALDLDLARVCVFGYASDRKPAEAKLCRDEAEEAAELAQLAADLDPYAHSSDFLTLITFNGHNYDLPLLMRRAKYLGVKFPRVNLDRYRSPHIDLYDELRFKRSDLKAHSLRWYMRRLGWADLLDADPLAKGGSDVAQAASDGRWDDVQAHALVDVQATLRLAQWLGVIPDGQF